MSPAFKTLVVIPARMSFSRFPGKPLKKILGIPMLAHCYERALLSQACDKLVIATSYEEIVTWAENHIYKYADLELIKRSPLHDLELRLQQNLNIRISEHRQELVKKLMRAIGW